MSMIPLGELLRFHAGRKSPDAPAVTFPSDSMTWRQLDAYSNRLARWYRSLGVGKGDRVAIALRNGIAYHASTFATWKLGATPATLSPGLSAREFAVLLELIQPRLLIRNSATTVEPLPVMSISGEADVSSFDDSPLVSEVGVYWKISSSGGSTGSPKAIVHDSPATFDPETDRLFKEFRLAPDSVLLNPGPLYHNAPFLFSSYGLFTGSRIIGMERFDAEEALRLIESHRVNWVCFVPTMMHRIWSLPAATRERYDLSSLETVWHMGSACPDWLKQSWIDWLGADRIWERYGGTEGFGSTVISGAEWLTRRGSVGRVIGKTKWKIIGDDGATCAPGEIGELYFLPASDKPPSFYLGGEAKRDSEGYFSFGDLGYRDGEDYLFLSDRRTDLIVRGGANIYPAEIEAALDEHPDVASSIVIGLPCDALGARVHAIIEPKVPSGIDLVSLHEFLTTRVVKYKLPESYEIAASSLRDDAGKARRTALRMERIEWLSQGRTFRLDAAIPKTSTTFA